MGNKNKIHIAFDIGVTSVGWCVVDDDGKILDYKNRWWYGVRLFDDASDEKTGDPKNISRRAARQLRRIIRRRHFRNETFIKSLIENGYVKGKDEFYQIIHNSKDMPVNLRVKGLKQELTKEEWICALFNYLQHRGFFYDISEDEDSESKSNDKTTIINEEEYPSVIQQKYWNNKGYYISSDINSHVSNKEWLKEIEVFLSNQKINDNVKNKFKELFTTIRDFSTGPGRGSKYGLWEFDPETQEYTKKDEENKTLWDKTIGKCSIYPNENRSIKKSGSAELFNFLNDLQNTRKISDKSWRISQEEKEKVLNKVLNIVLKEKPTLTKIAKALNINKDDIIWPRKNAKNKEVFEELNNIRTYYLEVNPSDFKPWLDPKQLDEVNTLVELKRKIRNSDKLQEEIEKLIPKLSSDKIKEIIEKIKGSSSSHSFSIKALNKFIIDLFKDEQGMEQMQLSKRIEKQNSNEDSCINVGKYIKLNKDKFWNLPISPSSKRAISQTFKVFNKLIKFLEKEYEIDTVTIEMAREHNSKETRETIKKLQDINKERKDEVDKKIKEDITEENTRENIKDSVRYKLYLYYNQEKRDIYTRKEINVNDLINHPENYNIDHIIPYSISYNDSSANKVLTTSSNNKDKDNQTPYQWFSQKGELDLYTELKGWWKDLFKDQKKKYSNLIYEGDPAEDYNEFASRALNDTRTSTKFVADCFKEYFNKKHNEANSDKHVLYINGLITNYLRKNTSRYFGEKNRDLYRHHADDAFLLAYISTNPKMLKVFRFLEKVKINPSEEEGKQIIDENKFDLGEFKREFHQKFNDENIFKNHMPSFSRQLNNKRTSVQFFDQTLYSGLKEGEEVYKVQKIKLIEIPNKEKELKKLDKWFPDSKNKPDNILTEDNIYKLLWKICHDDEYKYDDKGKRVNPFVQYMKKIKDKFPNDENNKNLIIRDDKENKYTVNSIRVKVEKVNKYFENKKIRKSNKNKIGFYDTMNWNSIYVYKNNGKYKIKTTNIGNKFGENLDKPDFKLYKGDIVLLKGTNHLFYIAGANDSGNNLELKPLMSNREAYTKYYNNNLILKDKQQYFVPINKLIDNFEKVEVDELGNIYKNKE